MTEQKPDAKFAARNPQLPGSKAWAQAMGRPLTLDQQKKQPPDSKDARLQGGNARVWWTGTALCCALIIAMGVYVGLKSGRAETVPLGANQPSTSYRPPEQRTPVAATVYVTRTGSKYHTASCSYLRSSKIAMALSQAKGQYGACSRCNPPQ